MFSGAHDIVEIEYTLTEEGKKYFKLNLSKTLSGDSIGGFCMGKATVIDVINFTESSDAMGQKLSHVAYTYKVTDILGWAKSEDLMEKSKKLKKAVKSEEQPVNAKDVFVLINKGWMHEGLFRKK